MANLSVWGFPVDEKKSLPVFPKVADLERVGTYELRAGAGAGWRYDRVLEYRLWVRYLDGKNKCRNGSVVHRKLSKHTGVIAGATVEELWTHARTLGSHCKPTGVLALVEQDWFFEAEPSTILSTTATMQSAFYIDPDTNRRYFKVHRRRLAEFQLAWLFNDCPLLPEAPPDNSK